jgi:hypothetical protein
VSVSVDVANDVTSEVSEKAISRAIGEELRRTRRHKGGRVVSWWRGCLPGSVTARYSATSTAPAI